VAKKKESGESDPSAVVDEPGMAERFQRGLQRAVNTPPQHRPTPPPKPKGRAHKTEPEVDGDR
jgi:hypothetical protein